MNQVKVLDKKSKSVIRLFFCFFTLMSSCQKKNKIDVINELNTMERSKVKEVLKKQLEDGASEEYGSFDNFTIKDLNALESVENEILKKHGYLFLTDKEFYERIDFIFKRKIDPNLTSEFLKVDLNNTCNKKLEFKAKTASDQFIYVSKKNKFISDFWALPELIDYEKDYPEFYDIENKSILIKDEIEKSEIEITRWKNLPNLKKNRQQNIQLLINRNKYLFNDSKASLLWLKFNDEYFLESLVKVFGYIQDKDLLKWVLDRNLNNDEFDKLLFTKTCENKLIFHKEVFDIMFQADVKSKKKYILYLGGRLDLPKVDDLNFSEATKIKALYCYYATKLSTSVDPSDAFDFFPKLDEDKFEEEFKKNNYYNLPDLKKIYHDTKYGGVGLPM